MARRVSGGSDGGVIGSPAGGCHRPGGCLPKCHSPFIEAELYLPHGPMAVLPDEEFRELWILGVLVVVPFAVQHEHAIGVLLDGARVAEVRRLRSLVWPTFALAVELRQRQYRALKLAGPHQMPCDFNDMRVVWYHGGLLSE